MCFLHCLLLGAILFIAAPFQASGQSTRPGDEAIQRTEELLAERVNALATDGRYRIETK